MRVDATAVANLATNCRNVDLKTAHQKVNGSLTQYNELKQKTTSNDNDYNTSTMINSSEYNSNPTITSKSSSKKIGWSNLHYNLSNCNIEQNNFMQDLVLLDSNLINTIFCNKSFFSNIKISKHPLETQTNGGTMTLNQACDIPYLGAH